MKITVITAFLLLGVTLSLPVPDDEELIITKKFFPEHLVVYKSKHDIVNVVVPLNSLNFEEEDFDESNLNSKDSFRNVTVFFAEADIDDLGKRTYKGLYVLKNGKATKILDNGVDAASSADDSKTVYLASTDGIYVYSPEHQTPVKYGSISDNVIGIAHEGNSKVFYILTSDHSVYKVLENGNKKEKLEDVIDAQQIVLDYSYNLYFYTPDKKLYVKTSEGVKEVEGLPEKPSKSALVKPPIVLEDGVVWIADGTVYLVYANATSKAPGIKFEDKVIPTGFGSEAALIQYYGYNKKMYEYNVLSETVKHLDELESYLNDKTNNIQALASQKKQSLRNRS